MSFIGWVQPRLGSKALVSRNGSALPHSVIELMLKIATLFSPFGGPHLVMDALRPWLGKSVAAIIAIAPVVLIYIGADSLLNPDTSRRRKTFIRIGMVGIYLLGLMNIYAIGLLVQGQVAAQALTILGLLVGTILIVVYATFARRALRNPRPTPRANTLEEFGGPIE